MNITAKLFSSLLTQGRLFFCLLCIAGIYPSPASAQVSDSVYRVGFLEGGDYISHGLFRDVYRRYLDQVTPEGMEIRFEPTAFKSGEWDNRICALHAIELKENRQLDMVVAIGPWAVEALQSAGFKRPILAVLQFDPVSQGLIASGGSPIQENLSIITGRFDLMADLSSLSHFMPVHRLGLIAFPSNDEELPRLQRRFEVAGEKLGISIVTAEGYNNIGTFAFFKALQSLDKKVDAIYISPLWGLDPDRIRQFMANTANRRVAVLTPEGRSIVERGALFYPGALSIEQSARISAEHTVRILRGKLPASLPVFFSMSGSSIVNLGTAHALGLSIPDDLFYGADIVTDPVPADIDMLRLPEAVSQAIARNQGIEAIDESINSAIASASAVASAYLPQVRADGSVGYIDDNAVDNSGGRFDNFRANGSIRLSQALLSLRKIRDKRLATQSVETERIAKQSAQLDLEYAVNLAYLELLESKEQLEVYRAYRRNVDKSLELSIVRELFEKGQDIHQLKWRQERLTATEDIVRASVRVNAATVALNSLLSQPGHQQLFLDRDAFAEEETVARLGALRRKLTDRNARIDAESFMVRLAFDFHPLLQANKQRQTLQRLRLSRHNADYLPEVGFRASLNLVDSLSDSFRFPEEHFTWSLGATVSLPLFLGGGRAHEGRKLTADLSSLEYERDLKRINIMTRVRVSADEFFSWSFRIPASGEAAQLSAQYYELTLPEYESGELSLGDILQSSREARDLRLKSSIARYAFFLAGAKLSHAIGLSTEVSGKPPVDEILSRLYSDFNN